MDRSIVRNTATKILTLCLFVAPCAATLPAQQSASQTLLQKEEQLQAAVDLLKQDRAELSSNISQSLIQSFDNEIKSKEATLAALVVSAKEAAQLEHQITVLNTLKDEASPDFLEALRREIESKQSRLAQLSQLVASTKQVADSPQQSGRVLHREPQNLAANQSANSSSRAGADRDDNSSGPRLKATNTSTAPTNDVDESKYNRENRVVQGAPGDAGRGQGDEGQAKQKELEDGGKESTTALTIEGDLTSTVESQQAASSGKAYTRTKAAINSRNPGMSDKAEQMVAKYISAPSMPATSQTTCSTGNFFYDCMVRVTSDPDNLMATEQTNSSGHFKISLPNNSETTKTYTLSTEADNFKTKRTIKFYKSTQAYHVNLPLEDRPVSLLSRAIVGYDQAGASSTKSAQKYFFDLYVSQPFPLHSKIDPDFGQRFRTWADMRIASVPQTGSAALGEFVTGFGQQVATVKVGDIAQSFQFLAGVEYRLAGDNSLLPSFDRQTKQKFTLALVAAFGTTTPTTPKDTLEVFQVSDTAPGLPPQAVGKKFVAFTSPERDRFYRQYYGGFRVQTFFFNLFDRPIQRFPSMVDVMYGQNEFVTRGHFRGGVFRIDGYFPLPYDGLKYINLFGTVYLKPGRDKDTTPLILQPAPAGTPVPGPDTVLVVAPQLNRDYYRFGVGIDFVSLVQTLVSYKAKAK